MQSRMSLTLAVPVALGLSSLFFLGIASPSVEGRAAAPSAPVAGRVPLEQGLTIVTALADSYGDYESIKTVERVSGDAVRILYHAETPDGVDSHGKRIIAKVSTARTVRRQDLKDAHEYMQTFGASTPEVVPGTTAIGASAGMLRELKTTGTTRLTFQTPRRQPSANQILSALTGGSRTKLDDLTKQLDTSKVTGLLSRIEPADVARPVIVNGQPTTLPAVHARGTFAGITADFYFLDDPDNPLALAFDTGALQGKLQVVQITFPIGAGDRVERELASRGRTEIYGIYFDFGSAVIRPESGPVLDEVADVLRRHPEWNLRVDGHTDNVGGEAANLELSNRRAAAVKQALVSRYHLAGDRLTTHGWGASRPEASNASLEGRARNRRVELIRR